MNIRICPVKRLYRMLEEENPESWGAIISSSSDIDAVRLGEIPHVFRQYADLDCESPGRSFSRADAAAFANFLRGAHGKIDTVYCCCDAGESRSPAVAAAVMRYFGMDDMPVWSDPRFHPNMLVFSMLADALGVPVSDGEKDFRIYTNQKAFRDAVRGG